MQNKGLRRNRNDPRQREAIRPHAGRETKIRRKRTKILLGGLVADGPLRRSSLLLGRAAGQCRSVAANRCGRQPLRPFVVGRRAAATPSRRTSDGAESPDERRSSNPEVAGEPAIPAVVATVNTQRITREDLARECLRHFGKEVLESMVNKRLIMLECQQQGITVTRDEVNAEIERMAKRFKIPVDQWLKMLKQERNVTPEQYANDIIWPTIALRKLAGEQLNVSREELREEFETQYGEQIKVRLIAVEQSGEGQEVAGESGGQSGRFRQPGQGILGRRLQRQPSRG